jgi:hypothetical protein
MFYRNAIVAVLIGVSLSACSADPQPAPVATPAATTTSAPDGSQDFMRQYLENLAKLAAPTQQLRPQPTTLEEYLKPPA